jgi:integrase
MRRGGNRLKYQVEQALKQVNAIGQSKKEIRDLVKEQRKKGIKTDIDTGIHSKNQMEHALSVNQNFGKWLKTEKGVKDLYQLKRSHYRDYIDYMKSKGVTNGHLINIETNLKLLAKGMDEISSAKGMKMRDWVPKTRIVPTGDREKPVDRAYTVKEVEGFREKLSVKAQVGVDLQMAFGLRLREYAYTKVAHIQEKDGTLYWVAVKDRNALNTAVGVTKAARPRETPVRPEYEARVRELIKGKKPHEFVSLVKYNALKSAYNRAGVHKGSHGFRHTYAQAMLLRELRRRGIENDGRNMVRRMIENHEAGFRKDHLVTRDDRPLYRETNAAVDQVDEWLGHGKGRIELVATYMRGV